MSLEEQWWYCFPPLLLIALIAFWSRYVEGGWLEEDGTTELVGGSRAAVESYLAQCEYVVPYLTNAPQWDTVSPWEATYWKTLPLGHRGCFRLSIKEEGSVSWPYRTDWYVVPDWLGTFDPAPNSCL